MGRPRGRPEEWSPALILSLLQAWADAHGHPPTMEDWVQSSDSLEDYHPCSALVRLKFGTWNRALEKAGLPTNPAQGGRASA